MRFLRISLSAVFFIGNVVLAHAMETNLIVPRPAFRVPRISDFQRGTRNAERGTVIFHIQDIHQNLEAQTDIANTIRSLVDQEAVDLIAVEGAFGEVDLQPFQSFPNPPSVKTVADFLLEQNKISGPLHAGLTGGMAFPPIVGIDDQIHYNANAQAFVQSAKTRALRAKEIRKSKIENRNKKEIVLNSNLLDFDLLVESYRNNELPLGDYVGGLSKRAEDHYPQIELFVSSYDIESRLDLNRVRHERQIVLNRLASFLGEKNLQPLLAVSEIKEAEFYDVFLKLVDKAKINLRNTPALDDYIRYARLRDQIQTEQLFAEMRLAESEIYESLIRTEKERDFVAASRRIYLEGKLVEFALTREEWEEYKKFTTDDLRFTIVEEKNRQSSIVNRQFEQFYRHAESRDHAMAENLRKTMKKHNAKRAVLVTGGFHSKGIKSNLEFRNSNFDLISIVPKITRIEGPRARGHQGTYLNAFLQEKTPLDKLFAGEKLFLATPFWTNILEKTTATLLLAQGYLDGMRFAAMQRIGTLASTSRSGVRRIYKKGKSVIVDANPFQIRVETDGIKILSLPSLITSHSWWPRFVSYWKNEWRKFLDSLEPVFGWVDLFIPRDQLSPDGLISRQFLSTGFPSGAKTDIPVRSTISRGPIQASLVKLSREGTKSLIQFSEIFEIRLSELDRKILVRAIQSHPDSFELLTEEQIIKGRKHSRDKSLSFGHNVPVLLENVRLDGLVVGDQVSFGSMDDLLSKIQGRVRISVLSAVRIKIGDQYLLVASPRRSRPGKIDYIAPGGVVQYKSGGFDVLESIGAKNLSQTNGELRKFHLPAVALGKFERWLKQGVGREVSPLRELRVRFVKETGALTPELFNSIFGQLTEVTGTSSTMFDTSIQELKLAPNRLSVADGIEVLVEAIESKYLDNLSDPSRIRRPEVYVYLTGATGVGKSVLSRSFLNDEGGVGVFEVDDFKNENLIESGGWAVNLRNAIDDSRRKFSPRIILVEGRDAREAADQLASFRIPLDITVIIEADKGTRRDNIHRRGIESQTRDIDRYMEESDDLFEGFRTYDFSLDNGHSHRIGEHELVITRPERIRKNLLRLSGSIGDKIKGSLPAGGIVLLERALGSTKARLLTRYIHESLRGSGFSGNIHIIGLDSFLKPPSVRYPLDEKETNEFRAHYRWDEFESMISSIIEFQASPGEPDDKKSIGISKAYNRNHRYDPRLDLTAELTYEIARKDLVIVEGKYFEKLGIRKGAKRPIMIFRLLQVKKKVFSEYLVRLLHRSQYDKGYFNLRFPYFENGLWPSWVGYIKKYPLEPGSIIDIREDPENWSLRDQLDTSFLWVWVLKLVGVKNAEEVAVKWVSWWAETAAPAYLIWKVNGAYGWLAAIGAFALAAVAMHIVRVVRTPAGEYVRMPLWKNAAGDRSPPIVFVENAGKHVGRFLIYFGPFFSFLLFKPFFSPSELIFLLGFSLFLAAVLHGINNSTFSWMARLTRQEILLLSGALMVIAVSLGLNFVVLSEMNYFVSQGHRWARYPAGVVLAMAGTFMSIVWKEAWSTRDREPAGWKASVGKTIRGWDLYDWRLIFRLTLFAVYGGLVTFGFIYGWFLPEILAPRFGLPPLVKAAIMAVLLEMILSPLFINSVSPTMGRSIGGGKNLSDVLRGPRTANTGVIGLSIPVWVTFNIGILFFVQTNVLVSFGLKAILGFVWTIFMFMMYQGHERNIPKIFMNTSDFFGTFYKALYNHRYYGFQFYSIVFFMLSASFSNFLFLLTDSKAVLKRTAAVLFIVYLFTLSSKWIWTTFVFDRDSKTEVEALNVSDMGERIEKLSRYLDAHQKPGRYSQPEIDSIHAQVNDISVKDQWARPHHLERLSHIIAFHGIPEEDRWAIVLIIGIIVTRFPLDMDKQGLASIVGNLQVAFNSSGSMRTHGRTDQRRVGPETAGGRTYLALWGIIKKMQGNGQSATLVTLPTRLAAEERGYRPFGWKTDVLFAPRYEVLAPFLFSWFYNRHVHLKDDPLYWRYKTMGYEIEEHPVLSFIGSVWIWLWMLVPPALLYFAVTGPSPVFSLYLYLTALALLGGRRLARALYIDERELSAAERFVLKPFVYLVLWVPNVAGHMIWNAVVRRAPMTIFNGNLDVDPEMEREFMDRLTGRRPDWPDLFKRAVRQIGILLEIRNDIIQVIGPSNLHTLDDFFGLLLSTRWVEDYKAGKLWEGEKSKQFELNDFPYILADLEREAVKDGYDAINIGDGSILWEVKHWLKEREPNNPVQAATILLEFYVFYHLVLLSLRIWDEQYDLSWKPGAPRQNLNTLQTHLNSLGNYFTIRSESLLGIAMSGMSNSNQKFGMFDRILLTLDNEQKARFSMFYVSNLTSQLLAQTGRIDSSDEHKWGVRRANAQNYALAVRCLDILLRNLNLANIGDESRREEILSAIIHLLYVDPEAFTNYEILMQIVAADDIPNPIKNRNETDVHSTFINLVNNLKGNGEKSILNNLHRFNPARWGSETKFVYTPLKLRNHRVMDFHLLILFAALFNGAPEHPIDSSLKIGDRNVDDWFQSLSEVGKELGINYHEYYPEEYESLFGKIKDGLGKIKTAAETGLMNPAHWHFSLLFPLLILMFPMFRSEVVFWVLSVAFAWAVFKAIQSLRDLFRNETIANKIDETVPVTVGLDGLDGTPVGDLPTPRPGLLHEKVAYGRRRSFQT